MPDIERKAELYAREKLLRQELVKSKIYLFGNYDEKLDKLLPDMKLKGLNLEKPTRVSNLKLLMLLLLLLQH